MIHKSVAFREMGKTIILFWAFLLLLTYQVAGQEFGGNKPSMKWKQIDTDTVRVIFPVTLQDQAQRVASTIHYLSRNSRRSIGDRQKKIDIVLQNQTIVSNGYVALAPFRSEFYMNAPQNGLSLGSNWLDMLSIHEYRHAMQFMNTRKGLTNAGYILTGELGWSYLSHLSIPNWFWEGDAVVMETALTAQGRGRLPSFYNGYKHLVMDENTYNYQKARNGSIKDYVPNHYELGFLLCNYGREQYDNDFWKGVIDDASRYKGVIYPFSKAIKRKTGLQIKGFYNEAIAYYTSEWKEQNAIIQNSSQINVTDKRNTFTSYHYPQIQTQGSVIVYKVSYKKIGGFYSIDEYGKETLIRRQGKVLDNYFSNKNGKLLWAELGQDTRWSWKIYSNIIVYDMQTKKRRRITHSSKYFSPDLSFDGSKIVAFHTSPELRYNLSIISSASGELIKELPNNENYYFSYPKWSTDDKHIVVLARDKIGKVGILKVDVSNGKHEVYFLLQTNKLASLFLLISSYFFQERSQVLTISMP